MKILEKLAVSHIQGFVIFFQLSPIKMLIFLFFEF